MIGNETRAAEKTGTAQPVQPLHPLGVEPPVRLLVFRLEDADRFALGVLDEVTATAALRNSVRQHPILDRALGLANEFCESRIL